MTHPERAETRLAEIQARAEAAEPGPWELDEDGSIDSPRGCIAHVQHHGNINTVSRTGEHFSHADGRFIANARQDIPWLLARVAELEGEVRDSNRCRDTYKQLYNHALDCVDQVFQQCSEIPNPLLPDFAQLGEDKFMAVVRLAKEHIKLTAQLRAAEQERDNAISILKCGEWNGSLKCMTALEAKAFDARVEMEECEKVTAQSTALRERSDRLLIWLKWFVGDDNVATALRIATGRGCAEWQLEEIRQLWNTHPAAAKEGE